MKGLATLALLVSVSACGELSKDPAEGLTFQPPAGWSTTMAMMGVDVFAAPGGAGFMTLTRMPPGPGLEEHLFDGATYRNARGLQRSAIRICTNLEATYGTGVVYVVSAHRDMNLEMVTKDLPDEVLVADYVYPIGSKPEASARAAIRNLCPSD